jgi:hypothetical protein
MKVGTMTSTPRIVAFSQIREFRHEDITGDRTEVPMMRAMTMQPPRDVPLLHPASRALRFARTVPGTQGLAELQTFSCRECSLWITVSADEHSSSVARRGV